MGGFHFGQQNTTSNTFLFFSLTVGVIGLLEWSSENRIL